METYEELSHVNSFSCFCFSFVSLISSEKTKTPKTFQCVSLKFFSFLWGSRGEDHDENVEWPSYASLLIQHRANITLSSPLNQMFADSSLVQCTCTIIIIHTVRSCEWKAIMTIYDEMIEMRKSWELIMINLGYQHCV